MDDGKSTLLGRLLFETKQVFEDQLSAVTRDSVRYGTVPGSADLALLVDGLQAEREQAITIDVAYRFMTTSKRRLVVADCPGHVQYTRNMATGASTADVAVVLVDARSGIVEQTCRHSRIVALFGVRQLVLAINKMDLVDYDERRYRDLEGGYRAFAATLGDVAVQAIPLSALKGDNVTSRGSSMSWYDGPTLLEFLETVQPMRTGAQLGFRMAVQLVNRPDHTFRGFSGRIAAGSVHAGDSIRALPSGERTTVAAILAPDGNVADASAGRSVTLQLSDEIDISRGDVLVAANESMPVARDLVARILGLAGAGVSAGGSYLFKTHTAQTSAVVRAVEHRIDVTTGETMPAAQIQLNELGVVRIHVETPLPMELYADCRTLGSFILIDRLSNETVAAGMVESIVSGSNNISWKQPTVDRRARAAQKGQSPACVWLTGLPASGKSTIARALDERLFASGRHACVLDGDNLRHGLNRDLGFDDGARTENVRRVAETARLMTDAGLIVIVALITPTRAQRAFARSLFGPAEFLEVFVDTPLAECARRDPKGLYAKAARGEIADLTGVQSTYEPPDRPDLVVRPDSTPEQSVERILGRLFASGRV